MPAKDPTYYWCVDLPGLTRAEARAVVRFARDNTKTLGPSVVDPRSWFTAHLDRDTVLGLVEALRRAQSLDHVPSRMLEHFEDWLAYSEPGLD